MEEIRLLVVDDSDFVRRAVCSLLRSQPDFQIIGEAGNGAEAIRKAQELQPNVIVLDVSMPEMGGFQAAPKIRQVAPDAKIVFLTQYSAAEMMPETLQISGWAYVVKTDISRNLIASVRELAKQ